MVPSLTYQSECMCRVSNLQGVVTSFDGHAPFHNINRILGTTGHTIVKQCYSIKGSGMLDYMMYNDGLGI